MTGFSHSLTIMLKGEPHCAQKPFHFFGQFQRVNSVAENNIYIEKYNEMRCKVGLNYTIEVEAFFLFRVRRSSFFADVALSLFSLFSLSSLSLSLSLSHSCLSDRTNQRHNQSEDVADPSPARSPHAPSSGEDEGRATHTSV